MSLKMCKFCEGNLFIIEEWNNCHKFKNKYTQPKKNNYSLPAYKNEVHIAVCKLLITRKVEHMSE